MNPNRGYRKTNLPDNAKRVFEGIIFDTYQWEQELYDGSKTIFEKVVRHDAAVVVPILPDGRLLMIEDTQPMQETILAFPAGRLEEGETPEKTAKRELLEETGYVVDSLEPWYEDRLAGLIDMTIYGFIGRGVKKIEEPKPDPGEKVVLHPLTFDEWIRIVLEKRIYRNRNEILLLEALTSPQKMKEFKDRLFG